MTNHIDPNQIVRGARAIGLVAGLFERDEKGKPVLDEDGDPVVDRDAVYYAAARGLIDVNRNGRHLVSTVGRIRASILGTPAKIEQAA
jgi:hypothetical protein